MRSFLFRRHAAKMMKYAAFLLIVLFYSCKGEEGEVGPKGDTGATGASGAQGASGVQGPPGGQGPQGPQGPAGESFEKAFENGHITGTIKGTRRDGTGFEQAFEFKLALHTEGFIRKGKAHELVLARYEKRKDENAIKLTLLVEDKDKATQSFKLNDFELSFAKILADRSRFVFSAETDFQPGWIELPMSVNNNSTYQLTDYGLEPEYYIESAEKAYNVFTTKSGSRLYFDAIGNSEEEPGTFAYLTDKEGVESSTSQTYGNLIYADQVFTTTEHVNLSDQFEAPADVFQISDYAYNSATGIVSFSFKVNVGPFSRNTSYNPAEITGRVSAQVFDGQLMREAAE
jgi:hypothetical protein